MAEREHPTPWRVVEQRICDDAYEFIVDANGNTVANAHYISNLPVDHYAGVAARIVAAVNAAEGDGWIRVADRLPPIFDPDTGENRVESLVMVYLYGQIRLGFLYQQKAREPEPHWVVQEIDDLRGGPPTHWRPLPALPEGAR